MAETLKKGTRVTGAERDKLAAYLKKRYEAGESMRALAASTGRSFGFIHRILTESGVVLRGRGGATRAAQSRRSSVAPDKTVTRKVRSPHSGARLREALADTEPPDDDFADNIAAALALLSDQEDRPWAGD